MDEQSSEAFENMPKVLQDFVMSDEVSDSIGLIAKEFEIYDELYDEFARYIFTLLTGVRTVDEFLQFLQNEVQLSEDKSNEVLIDVDKLILSPARFVLDEST